MSTQNLIYPLKDRGESILANHIRPEEKILVKLQGNFGQGLVITDKRLYVVKWGAWAGSILGGRCISYDFDRITGVKVNTGIATGTLEILTPSNQNKPKSYWGSGQDNANQADDAITFSGGQFREFREAANLCHDMIEAAKHPSGESQQSGIDDLEKLATLRDKGIITSEEFEAKKKKILGI